MQPDFYTGSAHKWPCGPKEVGVLYVNARAKERIHPSIISAYPGAVGVSRSMEAMGQRDEPAIIGFGEALNFQTKIGRKAIEAALALARAGADCRPPPHRRRASLDASGSRRGRVRSSRFGPETSTSRSSPPRSTGTIASVAPLEQEAIDPVSASRRTSTTRWPRSIAPSRPSRSTCARASECRVRTAPSVSRSLPPPLSLAARVSGDRSRTAARTRAREPAATTCTTTISRRRRARRRGRPPGPPMGNG